MVRVIEFVYDGETDYIRFHKDRIHIPTVAARFGLDPATLTLNGCIFATNKKGFTFEKYFYDTVIKVGGRPARRLVSQKGSLSGGGLFVDVLMEHGGHRLAASLLVDTGCELALNISEYKADQLGLPQEGIKTGLEMGQGHSGVAERRGTVLVKLLVEDGPGILQEDPNRTAHLEVWADIDAPVKSKASSTKSTAATNHKACASHGTAASTSSATAAATSSATAAATSSATAAATSSAGAGASPPTASPPSGSSLKTTLSPIKNGKDSKGYDAILGSVGMKQLKLGIDHATGKLYMKKRTGFHRTSHS